MTEHTAADGAPLAGADVESWAWLEERPIFTTHGEKGGNVTRVPPGAVIEPMGLRFALLVMALAFSGGATVAAAGLAISGLAEEMGPAPWWWLALGLPAAALTLFLGAGVYVRGMELIMRERPRNLLLVAGLLGGAALGLGALVAWWAWRASDIGLHPEIIEFPGGNRDQVYWVWLLGVGAAIAAVGCTVCGVLAARGIGRARRDVARILRLRVSGDRHPGIVDGLPDPATWDGGGDVAIRYQDETGEQVVRVRLNTYAHEIPVPGTRVVAITDDDGDLLVELHPDGPLAYHPDNSPYESDTGGGGSM